MRTALLPFIHLKSGNYYIQIGEGIDATNERAGARVVMYCPADKPGVLYVREAKEFSVKFAPANGPRASDAIAQYLSASLSILPSLTTKTMSSPGALALLETMSERLYKKLFPEDTKGTEHVDKASD